MDGVRAADGRRRVQDARSADRVARLDPSRDAGGRGVRRPRVAARRPDARHLFDAWRPWWLPFSLGAATGAAIFLVIYLGSYREHPAFAASEVTSSLIQRSWNDLRSAGRFLAVSKRSARSRSCSPWVSWRSCRARRGQADPLVLPVGTPGVGRRDRRTAQHRPVLDLDDGLRPVARPRRRPRSEAHRLSLRARRDHRHGGVPGAPSRPLAAADCRRRDRPGGGPVRAQSDPPRFRTLQRVGTIAGSRRRSRSIPRARASSSVAPHRRTKPVRRTSRRCMPSTRRSSR